MTYVHILILNKTGGEPILRETAKGQLRKNRSSMVSKTYNKSCIRTP